MRITRSQLRQKIAESKGNLACQVLSLTDSGARKTNNPFGVIMKRAAASVSVGTDYEDAVNRVATKEGNENAGTFIADKIWGGKGVHVVENKIVQHTETKREYLYCQSSDKQMDAFPPKVSYEDVSGNPLESSKVEPLLPVKKPSAKQESFGNVNKRNVRFIAFDNILAIKMNDELFEVIEG